MRVALERTLRAPIERVFTAFSDPALIAQWLRPSSEVKLSVLAFDFRTGGRYRFAYDMPDGARMVVGGVYQTIESPRRIVFSWLIEPPDEHAGIASEVTVQLDPLAGDGTKLVIHHDGWARDDAEARHAAGWSGAIDLLELELGRRVNEKERR